MRVVTDSYYILSKHKRDGKDIDSVRLNNMLYLTNAYSMALSNRVIYEEGFLMDLLGPYNPLVNNVFRKKRRKYSCK